MPVYVDDMRLPARVGPIRGRWSHLLPGPWDDLAELHAFAARLGLERRWFQGPPEHPWPGCHYDLTDSKRTLAVHLGAVEITWRQAGQLIRIARDRGPDRPLDADELAAALGIEPATLF
jgi:uncharacterized protein DUF4031